MTRLAWWLVVGALAGCPTQFTGEPKFPGGVEGCRSTCSRQGLEMSAFVYSGEYSTSCVCGLPPEPGAAPSRITEGKVQNEAAAAAATAATAAYQQRQRQQQQSSFGR